MNIGEEIVSAWLRYVKHCEFVETNLFTPDVQGEIDVVGIDINARTVYICEAAIHLVTGLQYVKDKQPNNVNKLVEKFSKDIEYANKYFPDFVKVFMLWSPVVRDQGGSGKHNQLRDTVLVQELILAKYGVSLELVINGRFLDKLEELRSFAAAETKDIKSPVVRLFQVEELTRRHVKKLDAKNARTAANSM